MIVRTARTGSGMAAAIRPPTSPAPICMKPIMAAAEPAILGNGASAAVVMAGIAMASAAWAQTPPAGDALSRADVQRMLEEQREELLAEAADAAPSPVVLARERRAAAAITAAGLPDALTEGLRRRYSIHEDGSIGGGLLLEAAGDKPASQVFADTLEADIKQASAIVESAIEHAGPRVRGMGGSYKDSSGAAQPRDSFFRDFMQESGMELGDDPAWRDEEQQALARGIDLGVDLRRTEARMAEQLLQRPQVRTAAEQVRGEAVAQGVRRSALRQAEPRARPPDLCSYDPAGQRSPAYAAKQRLIARNRPRHARDVILDRCTNLWKQRDDPCLCTLAGDGQRVAERKCAPSQRQRLADPQPRTVQQQQHRPVACGDPRLITLLRHVPGEPHGFRRRDRARQPLLHAWTLEERCRTSAVRPFEEGAHRRQLARRRRVGQPP